jgi:hypothetical protein
MYAYVCVRIYLVSSYLFVYAFNQFYLFIYSLIHL